LAGAVTVSSRNNRIATMLSLMDDSLKSRLELANDLKEFIPVMVEGMKELAQGVGIKEEQTTRAGETRTVWYTRAPNLRACEFLFRLANYEPKDTAETILTLIRSDAAEAEIKAGVARAKAKNLTSQTIVNEKNAEVFEKSLVDEEIVQQVATAVFSAILGMIQETPCEDMHDISSSHDKYQAWQMTLAEKAAKAYREVVSPYTEDDEAPAPKRKAIGA